MTGSLSNKVALVTGASRGIGRAIATTFARKGAAFIGVHYASNEQAALETVAQVEALGAKAAPLRAELSLGRAGAEALWDQFSAAYGAPELDILVNNAGVSPPTALGETSEAEFDRIIAINLKAPYFLIQAAGAHIRRGGRIINVSTLGVRVAAGPYAVYASSKGAIETLTLALAPEFGARGVTVNAVAPGFTDTDMNRDWLADPAARAQAEASSVFSRLGLAQDVADVAAFLATDEARWVTGQIIDASGGARL